MILGSWCKDRPRLEGALSAAAMRDDEAPSGFAFDGDAMVELSVTDVRCLIERIRTLESYVQACVNAQDQVRKAAGDAHDFGKRLIERAAL